MSAEDKRTDSRLRSKARSQGLHLVRSRRRNPEAIDYGTYMIVSQENISVAGERMSQADVERYLAQQTPAPAPLEGSASMAYLEARLAAANFNS